MWKGPVQKISHQQMCDINKSQGELEYLADVPLYQPKSKLDSPHQMYQYGTQSKMQTANTGVASTTCSTSNSVRTWNALLVKSLLKVAKGSQLAVKQLKGLHNGYD